MLCAATACNFSSLLWPAGSAPAALASLLFDPPEPQIIGKNSVSRLSYLFAHLYLLSSYSFSSDLLSSNLPLLSASALLCFSSLHIVGSLTSKLPSIMRMCMIQILCLKISAKRYSVPRILCHSTGCADTRSTWENTMRLCEFNLHGAQMDLLVDPVVLC